MAHTAIMLPAGRGELPHVEVTVAMAQGCPARAQSISRSSGSCRDEIFVMAGLLYQHACRHASR
ncbi:hypothetical protein SXCC_02947 [Gluconacetobacter sp. SXCC-1]|nr:hypothetical protein SXCC_02947 [Gluconacetobacter sp. SXCC-1]